VGKSVRDSDPEVVRGTAVEPGVGARVAGVGFGVALAVGWETLLDGSGSAAERFDVQPVSVSRTIPAVTAARRLLVAAVTGTG
jgi:hypothetical protein